jgi:uncharacterized protein
MKALIEEIVKTLVDNPEAVVVRESGEDLEETVAYEIKVDESDKGKLIGKNGKNINAIRLLIRAAAAKTGKNAIINPVRD